MAGENIGWRLENVVYIELLRRCAYDFRDVYYYKANPRAKEVDFVVCDKDKALELIQVAYEIDTQKSFNRETSALVQAAGPLHCDKLTLIAFFMDLPVCRFLFGADTPSSSPSPELRCTTRERV